MNIKYLFGAVVSLPLLPLMYLQGKRIRAKVPQLQEAEGADGLFATMAVGRGTLNLVTIGESTIAGVGVKTHEEGFTGSLAMELSVLLGCDVRWKVYARSGYTAQKVGQKLVPRITENHADLIVIGLGGNDAFTLSRPSKWKSDIRSLIESVRTKFPNTSIVFCNMPPIKDFPAFTPLIKFTIGNLVEILGEELQKIVNEFQDVYYSSEIITLNGWLDKYKLSGKKEDFFSDGVHPSKLTYQTWAKDIANEVFKNVRIRNALMKNLSS